MNMRPQHNPIASVHGYHAGHPWYYLLDGDIPTLKQIQAEAIASGYQGYAAADIAAIDSKPEPKRSELLRAKKTKFETDLREDISRYRKLVRELRQYRRDNRLTEIPVCCDDIHTSMSLKHAHLYNDFAHLHYLDELLNKQKDLFDF